MNYWILSISIVVGLINTVLQNAFSKKRMKGMADCAAFSILTAFSAAVILFITGGTPSLPSPYTVGMGMLFGVVTGSYILLYSAALSAGPLSYTVLIAACSMLIPTFCGALFWKESVGWFQVAGVALLIVAFYFGVNLRKDKRLSPRWLVLCVMVFLVAGTTGLLQKIHQTSSHKEEINAFLVIAFLTAVLILGGYYFIGRRKGQTKSFSLLSRTTAMGIAAGLCLGLHHKMNLYLSGVLPSILFFPIMNGGLILLSSLAGRVVFREKLTRSQIFSLLLGVVAVCLIGNGLDLLVKGF